MLTIASSPPLFSSLGFVAAQQDPSIYSSGFNSITSQNSHTKGPRPPLSGSKSINFRKSSPISTLNGGTLSSCSEDDTHSPTPNIWESSSRMSSDKIHSRSSLDLSQRARSLPAMRRAQSNIVPFMDTGVMPQDSGVNVSVGFRIDHTLPKVPETSNCVVPNSPITGLLQAQLAKTKVVEHSGNHPLRGRISEGSITIKTRSEDVVGVQDPLLLAAKERHETFKSKAVQLAFQVAKSVHSGIFSVPGNRQLDHCVEMAIQLAKNGLSQEVVVAGLLHNCLNVSFVTEEYLEKHFGQQVADLVLGASKLRDMNNFCQAGIEKLGEDEVDRLRAMLLAMTNVQSVMIMLADRLQTLRTLPSLQAADQNLAVLQETLKVYIPLANRLGVWNIKSEMEDLCFKHEDPETYSDLSETLENSVNPHSILSSIAVLQELLASQEVSVQDIVGRQKNIFGVHKKMVSKNKTLDEVLDIRAMRIVVSTEEECYKALHACHYLWTPIKDKTKDYIRHSKANGYQSLHTVVLGSDGLPLEIQIRTGVMHDAAENGVAAHWRYKEGSAESNAFHDRQVAWARYVLSWQSELNDHKLRVKSTCACSFPEHHRNCPHQKLEKEPFAVPPKPDDDDPVYVVVVDGSEVGVHELPPKCTAHQLRSMLAQSRPMDYTKFVVNGVPEEEMGPDPKFHMGDQIELVHENFGRSIGFRLDLSPAAVRRERERLATLPQFGRLTGLSTRKDFQPRALFN